MADAPPAPLGFSGGELDLIDRAARQFGQTRDEFIHGAAVTTAQQICEYWHLSSRSEQHADAFMPEI